ncbi:MAG: hypothetical protein QNJ54_25530 [Prochloraceae cyanobacterium]|nr:hypothetical protein [Prochloraceae cyanobacterium]
MSINFDITRPLQVIQETVGFNLEPGTVTSNDAKDCFRVPFYTSISPASFSVADVIITNGNNTVDGDFSNFDIRVGDGIASTSIAPGTTVSGVTPTKLTLSDPAIGDATETVTIDPGTFLATVTILEMPVTVNGSQISFNSKVYWFDGTKASAAQTETIEDAINFDTAVEGQTVGVDGDVFLSNARIGRN